MFDDDFYIEDGDFPSFNEDESRTGSIKHSNISSPQRKVLKRHETNLIHSFVEGIPPNDSSGNMKAMKRKFPGPAGLLPLRVNYSSLTRTDCDVALDQSVNNSKDKHDIEQASSQFGSIFETTAWKCAQNDAKCSGFQGIQNCNIAHLKRCAFSNKSKALKYSFLIVAVSNMDTGQDLFVTLKDSTGEIQGHIDSEVLEQFPLELRRGSVLVLKKVGVLKSRQTRGLYLLITSNTLAVIYPSDLGISKLAIFKEVCKGVDFSNLNTSLNASLDTSWNETSPRQFAKNQNHQPSRNSMQNKQFATPRTSIPNVENARRSNPCMSKQLCQSSTFPMNKPSTPPSSNTPVHLKQSLGNNSSVVHERKRDNDFDRSFTVLSQNGINREEDLSSTVNSLFEGIDTDSIFDDFF